MKESTVRGVSNQPLRLTRRQNNQTQKIDYQLTQEDCRRLLLEYSELNTAYELLVKMDTDKNGDNSDGDVEMIDEKQIPSSRHG